MNKSTVRLEFRSPAGSYVYEGGARFALVRFVWTILKHRLWHWWRGDGLRD